MYLIRQARGHGTVQPGAFWIGIRGTYSGWMPLATFQVTRAFVCVQPAVT